MKNFLKKLSKLLFPENLKCIICKNEIFDNAYNCICKNCLVKIELITNPCPRCGDNMANENTYCLNCKSRKETFFDRSRSVCLYSDVAKSLVLKSKFSSQKYLAKNMAAFMIDVYNVSHFDCDCITFVPSGKKRTKERGYNIAELLANNIALKLNLPVINTMERIKEQHQINKNYKSRQENIKDAYKILDNINLKNKTILLVDDVITTGATINECSRILKKAGASKVYGLTFAHTPKFVDNEKKD